MNGKNKPKGNKGMRGLEIINIKKGFDIPEGKRERMESMKRDVT